MSLIAFDIFVCSSCQATSCPILRLLLSFTIPPTFTESIQTYELDAVCPHIWKTHQKVSILLASGIIPQSNYHTASDAAALLSQARHSNWWPIQIIPINFDYFSIFPSLTNDCCWPCFNNNHGNDASVVVWEWLWIQIGSLIISISISYLWNIVNL